MSVDKLDYFTFGFAFGVILMSLVYQFASETYSTGKQGEKLLAECQRQLPRDQICELSAKVKEGK